MSWKSQEVMKTFDMLLWKLREAKPNDRSEEDRFYAVVITDVEKASAYFAMKVYNVEADDE